MGGTNQKGKQNLQNDSKGPKDQFLSVTDNDLKQTANLGNNRWFYCTIYKNWGYYNPLSEKDKNKIYWHIFL